MPASSKMDLLLAKAKPISDADTKVSEEGGGGGAPGTGTEIPLQPVEKTMVRQAVHLQPVEDPTLEQVEASEGGCDPVGSLCWNRLLAEPVAPWREQPMLEQAPGRTCDPMGDSRWSSLFLKEFTPWKRPTLEQFMKNCSPWEGLTLEKLVEDCLL
ncbi:hypothetical protein GRJ2_003262400 [Grus japonensis]|uniref:Uncharacterized protein n=1 Tax=Grus japonensis TaxID=30415 RepID=A0ABC9YG99_GRUJA